MATTSKVSGGYDPLSFSKELDKIENMCKSLERIEEILHQASMQSLLMNADLIALFDPVTSEQLHKAKTDCQDCSNRISQQH